MTKIEWTDQTWNPVTGCTKVSPGCANCYAERHAKRLRGRHGYPEDEPFRVTLHPNRLDEPLHWRKPRRVFVCSMGDLFHEDVPDKFIDRVFATMALAMEYHSFQVLTKRPSRMLRYIRRARGQVWRLARQKFERRMDGATCWQWRGGSHDLKVERDWPLPNVWLLVSAENQAAADERIPILLDTPAAVRGVSCEPLLGPLVLDGRHMVGDETYWNLLTGERGPTVQHRVARPERTERIDWIIVGGESGPKARPTHPDWARSIRNQCQAADIPFFFKQWGEWAPWDDRDGPNPHGKRCGFWTAADVWHEHHSPNSFRQSMVRAGKKRAGRLLDGKEWSKFPA